MRLRGRGERQALYHTTDELAIGTPESPRDERLLCPPGCRDTYERRELPDGSRYTIVKNYFTADSLRAFLAPYAAEDVQVTMGTRWWWLSYRLP